MKVSAGADEEEDNEEEGLEFEDAKHFRGYLSRGESLCCICATYTGSEYWWEVMTAVTVPSADFSFDRGGGEGICVLKTQNHEIRAKTFPKVAGRSESVQRLHYTVASKLNASF